MSPRRAKQELAQVKGAATNISSNKIRIHGFQIDRREYSARQNAVAESRGEALDLIFKFSKHVNFGSVGNMTIGPRNVLACGSPSGIE